MNSIKTRFAPSPTGYLHIGGLRTALYNYLFAKNTGGKFLLRIEDTDRSRYVEDAEKQIIGTLNTFGLNFENEAIHQSERLPIYKKYVEELINKGLAYYCFCSKERLDEVRKNQEENKQVPKYDKHCLNLSKEEIEKKLANNEEYVIRMKIPENEIIEFEDLVYGNIKINTNDLDDQVLIKSDGFPTYHMAVVVDDHEMEISHIIRGEEWLPSTPKHILLYKMFGWEIPKFCHLPLLLNPDRSKLSKRQGDVAAEDFLKKGYLPQAIINYIAFLGWNPKTTKEIYSTDELIKDFSIENINKAGAVFDINKLNWINAEYIRNIVSNKESQKKEYEYILEKTKEVLPKNLSEEKTNNILKIFSSRLNFISEIKDLSNFIFNLPEYNSEILIFKKSDKNTTIKGLELILSELKKVESSNWDQEFLDNLLKEITTKNNLTPGDTFWPTRTSLSGLDKSPSPAEILWILEKEESINRINLALEKLSKIN